MIGPLCTGFEPVSQVRAKTFFPQKNVVLLLGGDDG